MTPLAHIAFALVFAALGALAVLQWQAWQRGAWRRQWCGLQGRNRRVFHE